jgi:hypothetical protein
MPSSTAGQVAQGLSGPALVGAYTPGQVLAVLDDHLPSLFT